MRGTTIEYDPDGPGPLQPVKVRIPIPDKWYSYFVLGMVVCELANLGYAYMV